MPKEDYHGISDQLKAAIHRLDDAKVLLEKARWRGAMYLAGYAVECRLKAAIMKKYQCYTLEELEEELTRIGTLPRRRSVYTHELRSLLELSGAADRLLGDRSLWNEFNEVNKWVTSWRYSTYPVSEPRARSYIKSVEVIAHWIDANV